MITFKIDELVPCLKEIETGDIVETEVVRLKRKSFLSKFNSKTGWYVNWSEFEPSVEVYALVLKGTFDIQGLIALENHEGDGAIHIAWACTSPDNNIWQYGKQKYKGVGGHLFAIAGHKSIEAGYEGVVYAEAMDEDLLCYYIREFHAEEFPYGYPRHPYRFVMNELAMHDILEVYTYDDNGEEC